jgi:outer membrane protein assembly factor BamB
MNAMRRPFLLASWAALLAAALAAAEANWPQFRGPTAGVSEGNNLPAVWSTTKNVAWKVEVPGRGWSSPIVWGDKVFLTSVVTEGKFEEAKKGLYFGGERAKPSRDVHHWMVWCFDFQTGKKLWEHEAHKGAPASTVHIKNTYASETPVTDGERLYAYFGNVGLFCYDLDGKELWSQRWSPVKTRYGWGTAASPAVHAGRVFVVNDNEEKSFLVALDAKTGKQLWQVERDEKSNWATPYVWENERRTELVTCGTNRVRSYDLDGKLLWELNGMSSITIPTPFTRHGLLFVSSGYILDQKRPLFAIRPGAEGDITPDGDNGNKHLAWHLKLAGPYNPSPLVYGDYLYVLYDRGQLSCYDARTGKVLYDRERLSGQFTASPWAYGGKVFCLSEDGETYVIEAGPKFKVLGKNSLDEMCMATPAALRGSLLVRTLTKLYRIENGAGGK